MIKILSCLLDNRFGGPQKRSYSVAEELKKYNIETVFLFNERVKGDIPIKGFKCFLLKHMQCIHRKSPFMGLIFFCLWFPYNLYKICTIINDNEIDIVCTSCLINIVPVLAGKLKRKKNLWFLEETHTPYILKILFVPIVNLLADKIVVVSEKVGDFFWGTENQYPKKVVTIHTSVDIDKFNPDTVNVQTVKNLKAEFNISDNDFVVGAIGHINMVKGYEYFIKAASIVKRKEKKVKFIIVGKALNSKLHYYRKLCNFISALCLEKDIVLTGFRDEIPEILSIFDVFVLPSIHESCPTVVLEAMAMKVPVVATNVGGVNEQIINGESGVVVEPRRSGLLADGILKLLNLPREELDKMVNIGRERAEKFFSLDVITARYKQIYESIM